MDPGLALKTYAIPTSSLCHLTLKVGSQVISRHFTVPALLCALLIESQFLGQTLLTFTLHGSETNYKRGDIVFWLHYHFSSQLYCNHHFLSQRMQDWVLSNFHQSLRNAEDEVVIVMIKWVNHERRVEIQFLSGWSITV